MIFVTKMDFLTLLNNQPQPRTWDLLVGRMGSAANEEEVCVGENRKPTRGRVPKCPLAYYLHYSRKNVDDCFQSFFFFYFSIQIHHSDSCGEQTLKIGEMMFKRFPLIFLRNQKFLYYWQVKSQIKEAHVFIPSYMLFVI